jgi:hypothetical protein
MFIGDEDAATIAAIAIAQFIAVLAGPSASCPTSRCRRWSIRMSSRAPLSNGAGEATHLGEIGKTLDVPLGAATLGES